MAPTNFNWSFKMGSWVDTISTAENLLNNSFGSCKFSITLLDCGFLGSRVDDRNRLSILDQIDRLADVISAADYLVQTVWGSYLCVIHDHRDNTRLFFADPMYTVRLYYKNNGQSVLSIDPDISKFVDRTAIDWNINYLVNFAATQFGIAGQTPFTDVHAIPPGCAMHVTRTGVYSIMRIWPRAPQCGDHSYECCSTALDGVYSSIASYYENEKVGVAISGGVDSSASAILLRKAVGTGAAIQAVHYYTSLSPDLFERELAKSVAGAIGADLTCIDIENHLPFSQLSPPGLPSHLSQDFLFLSIEHEISRQVGGNAVILEGQGGDLVFQAIPGAGVILDAFRDGGLKLALSTTEKLAILHNESIPRILLIALRAAFQRYLPATRLPSIGGSNSLLNCRPFSRSAVLLNTGLEEWARQQPSFAETLSNLCNFLEIMTPMTTRTYTRRLNPFLMQPVVEATFKIKSYESFSRENDRFILRKIASDHIQSEVLWRRTKGTFDAGILRGIQKNGYQFKSMIEQGVLISSGCLKRKEVDDAIKQLNVGQSAAGLSLALIGCVEIFCAAWSGKEL